MRQIEQSGSKPHNTAKSKLAIKQLEIKIFNYGRQEMADTIIKIDLDKSPYEHDNIHNRWHPDIPIVATVNPGDDFIVECMDWTGGK